MASSKVRLLLVQLLRGTSSSLWFVRSGGWYGNGGGRCYGTAVGFLLLLCINLTPARNAVCRRLVPLRRTHAPVSDRSRQGRRPAVPEWWRERRDWLGCGRGRVRSRATARRRSPRFLWSPRDVAMDVQLAVDSSRNNRTVLDATHLLCTRLLLLSAEGQNGHRM